MKRYLLIVSLGLLYACSNNTMEYFDNNALNRDYSHKISEQQAINKLLSCISSTSASRSSNKDISNVVIITQNDLNINDNCTADTLFYIANFADNSGYAILAADNRTSPVYAILDNGSFKQTRSGFQSKLLRKSAQILIKDATTDIVSRATKPPLNPWMPPQRPEPPYI